MYVMTALGSGTTKTWIYCPLISVIPAGPMKFFSMNIRYNNKAEKSNANQLCSGQNLEFILLFLTRLFQVRAQLTNRIKKHLICQFWWSTWGQKRPLDHATSCCASKGFTFPPAVLEEPHGLPGSAAPILAKVRLAGRHTSSRVDTGLAVSILHQGDGRRAPQLFWQDWIPKQPARGRKLF